MLTSQLLANVYLDQLDQLDHHVKDTMGIRCYVRYMDDFVICIMTTGIVADFGRNTGLSSVGTTS